MAESQYVLTVVCENCGVKARVSKRSRRLYSHHLPGTELMCPASDEVVSRPVQREFAPAPRVTSQDGSEVAAPAPKKRKKKKPKKSRGRRSVSVRTVSGGLPGHGKRR